MDENLFCLPCNFNVLFKKSAYSYGPDFFILSEWVHVPECWKSVWCRDQDSNLGYCDFTVYHGIIAIEKLVRSGYSSFTRAMNNVKLHFVLCGKNACGVFNDVTFFSNHEIHMHFWRSLKYPFYSTWSAKDLSFTWKFRQNTEVGNY